MKKTLIFLSLLLAVVVSAGAKQPSKYPGYQYCGTDVSKLYVAGGSSVVGYLTCTYYCVPETDDCIFEYLYGKAPNKGIKLSEVFKEEEVGELYCYSQKKNQSIRNEFVKLTGQRYDSSDNWYKVLSNSNGTLMVYMWSNHGNMIHAWLKKNGKFTKAYWVK